jgi:hypothetical protein
MAARSTRSPAQTSGHSAWPRLAAGPDTYPACYRPTLEAIGMVDIDGSRRTLPLTV